MPENEKNESFSSDELALIGKVEREFTHYGDKFKMHTLNSRENLGALKTTLGIEDAIVKYDILKKGTLIYCIDEYNGKRLSLKDKEELIYGLQPALVEEIYSSYLTMLDEQGKLLEELKKN